jgi:tRNA(Leu) C34 or U34 (ribose-2'-O)-methylase TrmL
MYGMAFEFMYEFTRGIHINFLTKMPTPAILLKALADIKPRIIVCVPLILEKIVRKAVLPKIKDPKVRLLMNIPIVGDQIKKRICMGMQEALGGNFYEAIIGGAAINADAVKASAGALMRIDTCKVPNLRVAAYYLKQSGFKLIAATEKTDNLIYDVDMTGPCAIIMGSEGKGISQSMLDLADAKAAIPMAGEITSLNVSVASAVLMYEAVRQRVVK